MEKCRCLSEKSVLLDDVYRSDVGDFVAVNVWLDLLLKVGQILYNSGNDKAPAASKSNLDSEMNTLVGMNTSQKNQIISGGRGLKRIQRHVNAVIDSRQIIQPRGAIGVAYGHKISITIFLVNRHDLRRGESMDGGQHRRPDQPAKRQRHEIVVAMNKIELTRAFEGFRDVKVLGDLWINR